MATKAKKAIPEGYHSIIPNICVEGAAKAIDWYKKVFGAQERMRMPGPEGKIMHAEITIGDSVLMLNDPMMDAKTAKSLGGTPVSIMLYTAGVDAVVERATKEGAKLTMPPADMFWGDRFARFTDPYGYEWAVATHIEDLTPEEMMQRQKEFEKQQMAQHQHAKK